MARGKKSDSNLGLILLLGGGAVAAYFLLQKPALTVSTALGNISIPPADVGVVANAAQQLGVNVQSGG